MRSAILAFAAPFSASNALCLIVRSLIWLRRMVCSALRPEISAESCTARASAARAFSSAALVSAVRARMRLRTPPPPGGSGKFGGVRLGALGASGRAIVGASIVGRVTDCAAALEARPQRAKPAPTSAVMARWEIMQRRRTQLQHHLRCRAAAHH